MTSKVKMIIKNVIPPFILNVFRTLKPQKPMYEGCFVSHNEMKSSDPWISKARLLFAKNELLEIISKQENGKFIPDPNLRDSHVITSLVVNMLSSEKTCRVLDFAGGTGAIYYTIRPFLLNKKNVSWHVIDREPLIKIAEKFKNKNDNLFFFTELPKNKIYDLVFINTSLQYIYEYETLIKRLINYNPEYLLMTRLVAGEIRSFFTYQKNVQGGKTPSLFLNVNEVVGFIENMGYKVIFKAPAFEDKWNKKLYKNVPDDLQLYYTINLLFKRKQTTQKP